MSEEIIETPVSDMLADDLLEMLIGLHNCKTIDNQDRWKSAKREVLHRLRVYDNIHN